MDKELEKELKKAEYLWSEEVREFVRKEYYDPSEYYEFKQKLSRANTIDLNHKVEFNETLDELFYIELVEKFIETGKHPSGPTGDAITDYLITVMHDPSIRLMVLTDDVRARIFQDSMMRFVDAALKRKNFSLMRKQSEVKMVGETLEWSPQKREDGQQALLDMLDLSYKKYGFRTEFFRNQLKNQENLSKDEFWESLNQEYKESLNDFLQSEIRKNIKRDGDNNTRRIKDLMNTIPNYLKQHDIDEGEFSQAWGMMGGMWNEYDFKVYLKLARQQKTYPELITISQHMGRTISPDGEMGMWVGSGRQDKLEHSSKSDIHGVTFGKNLDSLLPAELAQLSDDDFENVFLLKYTTNKLQSFLHRSHQLAPNKRLERKRAREKGPMIVCVDTSGSMQGKPLMIAHSMVLKLNDIAHQQKRALYIIAFSVSARPIEAKKDRAKLLEFLASTATGSTEGTKMMQQTIELLSNKPEYMSADVLIISDFRMQLVKSDLMDAIQAFRSNGTCFYGLQIGMNPDNKWEKHIDKTFKVGFHLSPKY